jgi:hypothetical protein
MATVGETFASRQRLLGKSADFRTGIVAVEGWLTATRGKGLGVGMECLAGKARFWGVTCATEFAVLTLSLSLLMAPSPACAQGTQEYAQLPARAIERIDASQIRKARKTGRITVPLPGGTGHARALVLSEQRRFGVDSLRAQEGGTRILVTTNGVDAFGFIERDGTSYVIDTVGGEVVVAEMTRLSSGLEGIPESLLYDDVIIDPERVEQAKRDLQRKKPDGQLTATALEPSVVDIAIFYEQTIEELTGFAGIRVRAQSYVDYTNEAFRASQIPLTLRLVYVGPYPGTVPADPMMGQAAVASWGASYGADLKHLLFDSRFHPNLDYAGKAQLVGSWGVTVYPNAGSTFRHEIGHNFGAHHDRPNVFGNVGLPIAAYNFAHLCSTAGTAMHYWTQGMQSLRDHYSDPQLGFDGQPCGIAFDQPGGAHNAKAIDVMRGTIAAYQTPQPVHGTVGFVAGAARVSEGSRVVTVRVRRDGDLMREGSVEIYSVDESTRAGEDYEPVRERVRFAPGQSDAEVRLQLLDDSVRESVETLKLALAYPNFLQVGRGEFAVTIDPDLEVLNPAEELSGFAPAGVLRWAPAAQEDAYEVWVYRDPGLTQLVEFSGALTARNYQFTRLQPGETYYVRMFYRSGGTWSERSVLTLQTAQVVTRARLINPQEEIEAFVDQGVLRWSPVDAAEVYEVWVYADPSLSVLIQTSGPIRETQYRLGGLVADSTIYVRIFSRVAGVFHAGDALPVVVTGQSNRARLLNPQEELDGFATDGVLRWTPVTGATAYEVWIFTNPNSSEIFESSGSLVARAYQTRSLVPGATYYVQVYAQVNGQWHVGAPFRIRTTASITKSRLTNPQEELEALPTNGILRWSAVPGADAYELWMYTNPGLGGVAESHAAGTARSYQPTKLCAGGTYFVMVFARVAGQWHAGWPTPVTVRPGTASAACAPPVPAVSIRADRSQAQSGTTVALTWDAKFANSCFLSHSIDGRQGWYTDQPVGFPQTWSARFYEGSHVFSLRCTGSSGTAVAQTFFVMH